jgi:alpha-galactosidase
VTANHGSAVVIKTSAAEFDILANGSLQTFLVKEGSRLTVDEPEGGASASGDYLVSAGKDIRDFTLDFPHVKVTDAHGKVGPHGKRIEIGGRGSTADGAGVEKTQAIEVYDDFPNLAITTVAYKNVSDHDLKLDRVIIQRHRLNAALVDPTVEPYRLWSFQGSSYDWGKDEILPLSKGFFRPNLMGSTGPKGFGGGGIPVVDFWTASVGEAFGYLETIPLVLSLPVKVENDGRISTSMVIEAHTSLKPGEVYSTPRSFVAIHTGDFYEPLRLWSSALQREDWSPAEPSNADYAVNWCGWGYESDFTPAQMLNTIPKLKELGIKWATLDYRWFDNYGDWEPRPDTFPDDLIRKVVDEFHKQGILLQLWWQPIAVEDGIGKHPMRKPMTTARLMQGHPDWLILDQQGHHARMINVGNVAALCPALPEVQEYHRKLVEKFIRDWGYDGNKMDSVFSVPPCYNPKHHHKSPEDSIKAMADVYRVIFQTTRFLKPESVTQICPCGTTPNLAWLPYEDQAVTADPVGSLQVRRRIKMYKALLGPRAAVYGDHVELSEMRQVGKEYVEEGRDFASTVGTGGVVGTKFTWPGDAPRPRFEHVLLTPEKEVFWKKWIDLYNSKMLASGTFRNLYTIGYDDPEGYAIEKDGKMYYAFFAATPSTVWKGQIELRGLQPGKYQIFDYENNKRLGELVAPDQKLVAGFTGHLLIEVSKL